MEAKRVVVMDVSGRRVLCVVLTGVVLCAQHGCGGDTTNPQEPDVGVDQEEPIRMVPDFGGEVPDQGVSDMMTADVGGGQDQDDEPDQAPPLGAEVPGGCTPGEFLACGGESSRLVCHSDGRTIETQECGAGEQCLSGVGCTTMVCLPGTLSCASASATQRCRADGSGFEEEVGCAAGRVCTRGTCESTCEQGKYRSSYIGCEYWSVDLDQYPDRTYDPPAQPHSVVISNPNDQPATVSFRVMEPGYSVNVTDPVVPPNQTRAFTMPRLDVDGTGLTSRSIQVTSTLPVIAHQFNPLNNERVFSNDASLLLPATSLGDEYYVMMWPSVKFPAPPIGPAPADPHGYMTIVATEPGETALNVVSRAQLDGGGGISPTSPGVARGFTLQYGQVLNLQARAIMGQSNDVTGSWIKSNKPVAVFAGIEAINIGTRNDAGLGNCCMDHMEVQLLPLKDWGRRYIAALSPGRGVKEDYWRIMAGEDGVVVTTNPPQAGANGITLNKGDFVTLRTMSSFEVSATGKILVGQYLVSQQQTSEGIGDPAMLLVVPVERFRRDYQLLVPSGYQQDFITLVRPVGSSTTLNGQPVTQAWTAIGTGAYESTYVRVQPGVVTVEGDQPFGVSAYGYDNAVSYGYMGGLNLVEAVRPE